MSHCFCCLLFASVRQCLEQVIFVLYCFIDHSSVCICLLTGFCMRFISLCCFISQKLSIFVVRWFFSAEHSILFFCCAFLPWLQSLSLCGRHLLIHTDIRDRSLVIFYRHCCWVSCSIFYIYLVQHGLNCIKYTQKLVKPSRRNPSKLQQLVLAVCGVERKFEVSSENAALIGGSHYLPFVDYSQ